MISFLFWDIHILLAWVLGIYTFVHSICMIAKCIMRNYVRQPLDLQQRYGKGTWVLVTGANGGIGGEYCLQLAKKGFNIVLCGRNEQGISDLEAKIKKASPQAKTKILIANLGDSVTPDYFEKTFNQVKDLDISVIVNNAVATDCEFFHDVSVGTHLMRARVNIGAPTMLIHFFINKLLARSKKSAIINISSLSQNSPAPFLVDYPASKRYLSLLSYHLQDNYGDHLDIQDLLPGFVSTKLNDFYDGPDAITPDVCVQSSLRDLGQEFSTTPAAAHSFTGQLFHVLFHFARPVFRALICGEIEKKALEIFYKKAKASAALNKD